MDRIPGVQAVMTPFPYSVGPDAPLRAAREMMRSHEVRHLPVLGEGRLLGVITDRDIKRALDPSLGLPPKDELFVDAPARAGKERRGGIDAGANQDLVSERSAPRRGSRRARSRRRRPSSPP